MRAFGCLILAAWPLVAGTEGLVADGAFWKQTIPLHSSSEGITRLHVTARGRVRIHGERGITRLLGTLTERVKAPSPAAAKAKLQAVNVTIQNQGSIVTIDVTGPDADLPELTLELTIPRQVRQTSVQTRWGDVEATELEGTVFIESGGGFVRLDAIGQGAIARTAGGEMRLGRIGGSLNCATGGGTIRADSIGGNAELSTGGGEIWVREIHGALRATTAGGSIHIQQANGEVVANSGGGVIEVAHARGAVAATTTGGSIEVNGGRNLQCESGVGSIRFKGVDGALRAVTADGMILAEIRPGAVLGDSLFAAQRGDIIVYLPSNLAVTVRARTEASSGMAGRIVSEFKEVEAHRDRRRFAFAEGRLNGGGPVLELAASGGTIHLRRLKP